MYLSKAFRPRIGARYVKFCMETDKKTLVWNAVYTLTIPNNEMVGVRGKTNTIFWLNTCESSA